MTNQSGTEELRIDFQAELRYTTSSGGSGGSSTHTEEEPGYLSATNTGAVQYFDTPRHKLYGKAKYHKPSMFDVVVPDVSSLKWNEATGAVHLNTRKRKGIRSLRPLYFSDREVAIPGAEQLALLWFPGGMQVRTEMSDREKRFDGMFDRAFSVVFILLAIAFIAFVINSGAPWFIALIFGAFALLFAFAGKKSLDFNRQGRDEVKALIAEGKTWVEVANPTFQAD